jgi:DNA-binding transcriptional regulator GbsR (MarR family)
MKTVAPNPVVEARRRMVELGGRTAQDLGFGRIPGQILVYLYSRDGECSLDQIGEELGLSKAAVSTAVRNLETLGLVRQVWKQGDRRNYYRTAENLGAALQRGLFDVVRRKVDSAVEELNDIQRVMDQGHVEPEAARDAALVRGRIQRIRILRDRAARILGSRLIKLLVR